MTEGRNKGLGIVVYIAEGRKTASKKSMAEFQMILVDRQRIARDTMAFWLEADGANFEFKAGQHPDFVFTRPYMVGESHNSPQT